MSMMKTVTRIYEAARDGSSGLEDLLKRLTTAKRKSALETNIKDGGNNTTPLIIAARNGHSDSVRILLRFKADIEARGTLKVNDVVFTGCTPLWAATAIFHEVLTKRAADVDSRPQRDSISLRDAVDEGYFDVVKCLVRNGADVNTCNDQETTPLMMACCSHGQTNVITYLIDNGAILDLQDKDGWSALHFAVYWENFTNVRELLASGASQLKNNEGLTPFLLASNDGRIEMVEYFITRPECTTEQKIDAIELLGATLASDPDSRDLAFTYMKRGMVERFRDPAHPLPKKEMEPVEAYQNGKESQSLAELALLEGDDDAIRMEGLMTRERILGTDKIKQQNAMIELLSDEAADAKLINANNQTLVDKARKILSKGRGMDATHVNTGDGERIGCGRGRGFVHGVDVIQKKGIDVNYQKNTLAKKKAGEQAQFREMRNLTAAIVQERERGGCVPNVELQLRAAAQEPKEIKEQVQSLHGNTDLHFSEKVEENEPKETIVEGEVIKRNTQPRKRTRQLTNFPGQLQERVELLSEMTRKSTNAQGQLRDRNGQLRESRQELLDIEEQPLEEQQQVEYSQGQLLERDEEIRDMMQQLQIVQGRLQEREGQLTEITQQLTNAEVQLSKMTQQLTNSQGQLREKNGQLRQKTQLLTNTRGQLRERDGQLREKTQQLTNTQGQLQERVGQLSEKDRQLREKDEQLREKTQQLTNTQGQLREKDKQLRETTQQLTNVQGQLRERDVQLRQKTQQFTNVQGQLRQKDGQLREKTQQLTNTRRKLQEKDGQMREKTQLFTNVEGQLRERDGQLREKTRQLTNVEGQLRERDGELLERTQQLTDVRGQMYEKDEQITNLQDQVTSLRDQVTEKELELNELETTLSEAQQTLNKRQQPPDWVIARDQIQLTDNYLGRGGYGSVLEGKYCGCVVAVKQIHELILSEYSRRLFEREMRIAATCRHPCLLQFIGATCDEGSPLFVTELMESSLRALLEQRPLSSTEVSVVSMDVARALNYLHLKKPSPIIHRDVSSANVLLWRQGDQWRGKVSDYGTAKFMQQTMTVCPGTRIYSAPEAFTTNQTEKVDVYSFGVLLCEICIREQPDPERRKEQVVRVKNRAIRALIRGCLHQDPKARPSMEDIIRELQK